jgi:excisionase family DNA binding protein
MTDSMSERDRRELAEQHRDNVVPDSGVAIEPRRLGTTYDFLTVNEVAALLRVSKMTVYRLVHDRELSAVKIGGSIRVARADVAAYVIAAYVDKSSTRRTDNEVPS